MSEVIESVEIEVGIVVSETAKKAIAEIEKELDKITDAGGPGGAADISPAVNEALDAAVDNAKESADKIIDELERITDAGAKAVDVLNTRPESPADAGGATPDIVAPIEEAGKAAETIMDRLDRKIQEVADTIVENFGDANGGIGGFFSRWAESSKEKFGEIIESGRHAANVLEEAFGKNIYTDAISGTITLLEKTQSLGAGLTSLGASVSKWAPQLGGAITAAGTAMSSAVPVVVGGAAQMAVSVASFAVRFAGPIGAVVGTLGALGFAWYKAGQESKKAIENMERIDGILRANRAGQRAITDTQLDEQSAGRGQAIGDNLGKALESANLAGMVDELEHAVAEFRSVSEAEHARTEQRRAAASDASGGSDAGALSRRLAEEEKIRDWAQETLELARQKYRELEKQTAEAQKQLDLQRKEAKLALDVLDRQEQARQTIQEKLGRMEAGQQAEVLDLLKEIQSGSATTEQVQQFEKLFGTIDDTRKFYAEQSNATVEQLDALGAKLTEKDAKLLAAAEKLAGGKGVEALQKFLEKLAADEEQLNATMATATEELGKTTAELTELIGELTKTINTMKRDLEELKFQQRNGVGGV